MEIWIMINIIIISIFYSNFMKFFDELQMAKLFYSIHTHTKINMWVKLQCGMIFKCIKFTMKGSWD